MQKIIHFLVAVWCTSFVYADNLTDFPVKVYNVSELKEDVQAWRNTLEKTHANLYLYITKMEMDKTFDSFYTHIDTPMTALKFYSYISPLVSIIKDGHNYIHPNDELTEYYNKNALFFPFHVIFLDKKMLIDMNLSGDSTIKTGMEILSINGITTEKILNELKRRLPRDGYNETYPLWILNEWFREYYSYSFGHPEIFYLSLKMPDNNIAAKEIKALSKDTILAARKRLYPERLMVNENKKAIAFNLSDTLKTGILTIYTFSGKMKKEYHQSFKKEIKNVFTQIKNKKITHLIIDLRNNQGGASQYGSYLVSYLLSKPFLYVKELYGVKKKYYKSAGEDRLKKEKNCRTKWIKPNPNPFTGDVYLLTNGGSFSNSGILSSCLQTHKRAVIIGEETGGNKTILTSTFSIKSKTKLPNTKIICDKPDYRTIIRDVSLNDGHGVFPDYKVEPTIDEIVQNIDVSMEKAVELIIIKKK